MRGTLLVTGAAGFTGRYLMTAATKLGYRCVAVVQSPLLEPLVVGGQPIAVEVCDLTDRQVVMALVQRVQPDYVVHLAAISFVAHGVLQDIYLTNVVGTANLMDALQQHASTLKKVLVASSGNVYGNSQALPITETTSLAPVNDYAVSKVAMEYALSLRSKDLPLIITRPFNYTGVGQAEHFLIPKIVHAFAQRQPTIELGNLDVARDFTDVRDLVHAYLLLLASDAVGELFNICSGKAVPLLEVVEHLNALAGYRIDVQVNPAFVRANEIKTLYGSDAKLRCVIGDYRQFADLQQTLAWMLATQERE